ncbi:hypothetical protein X798_01612 [Onchocerca flexuosa]|uniref:Uncharacterized protein n=1 Tax=Onchocerca flexuosa TaxID=387005 RepID=A0A238C227_9BILA|nr:hypothetical protein X798_01612 [Onchocerca flexuosa]
MIGQPIICREDAPYPRYITEVGGAKTIDIVGLATLQPISAIGLTTGSGQLQSNAKSCKIQLDDWKSNKIRTSSYGFTFTESFE